MISMMGGKRLNAYTTEDRTVYTVDIPSNELERFLTLEGLRFKQIVNRLFHTEIETVYEEKNRTLDSDGRKQYWALYQSLFKDHPIQVEANTDALKTSVGKEFPVFGFIEWTERLPVSGFILYFR